MDDQFKHSHKYTYLKLPSYHCSVIPLVRPKRLKEELNDQFREAYPWLNTTVTLSKLRNLKKDLFAIAMEHKACDVSTVAMAWVYFEHLVFRKNLVHKGNRKQLAGTCLVLAYKFNEPESIEHDDARDSLKTLASLIRKLDRKDPLDFEDITAGELEVFAELDFTLHLAPAQVYPHINEAMQNASTDYNIYYEFCSVDLLITPDVKQLMANTGFERHSNDLPRK
jgi:hypothetical protein